MWALGIELQSPGLGANTLLARPPWFLLFSRDRVSICRPDWLDLVLSDEIKVKCHHTQPPLDSDPGFVTGLADLPWA